MFENDISKHVEKKPGKLRKIQDAPKKSPKFQKYDFCRKRNLCQEVYVGKRYLWPQIHELIKLSENMSAHREYVYKLWIYMKMYISL